MRLEFDEFQKVYQKDVNNYIIIPSGPLRDEKRETSLEMQRGLCKKLSDLDYDLPLSTGLLELLHRDHPGRNRRACDSLRDFQKVVKISSKYKHALYCPLLHWKNPG